MNTKIGIVTRGYATRENTAFGVPSVKYNSILQWKQSNIIYLVRMEDSRLNFKVK